MNISVVSEKYGTILYEENFWTGKKTITVNGNPLKKISKNTYSVRTEKEEINVRLTGGSFFYGLSIEFPEETVQISPPSKWYEIVLALAPFALVLFWGNNIVLCSIVPVIGGAIGGGISGAFMFISMNLMKKQQKVWLKLLIGFGMLALTFAICALIGMAFVGMIG